MSDLHLEFGEPVPQVEGELLVLAGDIGLIKQPVMLYTFIERMSKNFDNVLYVPGNHEYYHDRYSPDVLKNMFIPLTNVHVMNNDNITIDGIKFVGATLWTDETNPGILKQLNDFHIIKGLNVYNAPTFHRDSLNYIKESNADVVITHHAPSFQSVAAIFRNSEINSCFASELDTGNAKLWIHGHMHNHSDYIKGDTRIVCNPRGYPNEQFHYNYNFSVEI